jgi:hypothetical protein
MAHLTKAFIKMGRNIAKENMSGAMAPTMMEIGLKIK